MGGRGAGAWRKAEEGQGIPGRKKTRGHSTVSGTDTDCVRNTNPMLTNLENRKFVY